jgi:hypothetical protein
VKSLLNPLTTSLIWGIPNDNSPDEMRSFLNQYVVGVIAALDQTNPNGVVFGNAPVSANVMSISWTPIWVIAAVLVAGHALLLVIFTTISSRVLIPNGNPLTIAKLLTRKSLDLNKLTESAVVTAADAYKRHGGHDMPQFVYSYRENEKQDMNAEFAEDLQPLPLWDRWPSDWYEKAHL